MRSHHCLLFCGLLFASASSMAQSEDLNLLKAHAWKLIDLLNADGTAISDDLKPNFGNRNGSKFITLQARTDSTFDFQTYTNDGTGTMNCNNSNDSISFKIGMMSKVREHPWGELFIKTSPQVKSYEVTDTDLKLKYDNGTKYMHFIK